MMTKIFVNLPVKNLNKSVEFFTRLGFKFNPQFTDETATYMIVGEDIFVMLLTEDKFKTFTPKEICDATKSTEVLVCLSSESREEVDEMVRKAVAAGGTTYNEAISPKEARYSKLTKYQSEYELKKSHHSQTFKPVLSKAAAPLPTRSKISYRIYSATGNRAATSSTFGVPGRTPKRRIGLWQRLERN